MKLERLILIVIVLCTIASCSGTTAPIPDIVATQMAVETAAVATLRAEMSVPARTPAPAVPKAEATPATWLTLDGKEADGTLAVQSINVWKDYDNRGAGIADTGQHGQRVKLIRRSGDGVKIELPNGVQGWVTYYFIKEYK